MRSVDGTELAKSRIFFRRCLVASYFNYEPMTIFEIEVHCQQLELLQNAADEYHWNRIKSEVKPRFKETALGLRHQRDPMGWPQKPPTEEDWQEIFPFWDEIDETTITSSNRNPKKAGRKRASFTSDLKVFLLALVLRTEPNPRGHGHREIAGNPAFGAALWKLTLNIDPNHLLGSFRPEKMQRMRTVRGLWE